MSALQSEITDAGGCRRRLNVTVPPDEVAKEFDETLRRYARAISVPGFRRGKVPPAIVRKRFAHEIEEEVREHIVRQGLREALEKHEVLPLHNPVVDSAGVKEGEPYAFSALFEVRPAIRLGEYHGLTVGLPDLSVTDEDVASALDAVRERLGKFVPVEPRPIVRGDFAIVNLRGQHEDGKGKDFAHEGVMIEVGSENNLPEFEAALAGMTVGESKSFTVSYPAEFDAEHLAGRHLRYDVEVKEIKVKEIPPADDELSKDLGKEGSLADLKEEIRRDLVIGRRRNLERQAKESLLRQLIEGHPVDVPEVLVQEQLDQQIEDFAHGMLLRGVDPSRTNVDWHGLREKQAPIARQRVLGSLILDEIAKKEGISASDSELDRRVLEEARGHPERLEKARKGLADQQTRQAFKNQLVREKSLDFLLKNATIKT